MLGFKAFRLDYIGNKATEPPNFSMTSSRREDNEEGKRKIERGGGG